jgi:Thioesterase-like superfamily
MEQDGKLIALALAAFSIRWQAPEAAELPMPVVAAPGPERATPKEVMGRIEQGLAPTFLRHLVLQPRIGHCSSAALAYLWKSPSGSACPIQAARWTRSHSPYSATSAFRLRSCADPAELCLARLATRVIHDGFFESDGVVWAADGTVLAHSRQLAILMPSG